MARSNTALRIPEEAEVPPFVTWSVDRAGRYTAPLGGNGQHLIPPVQIGDSVWERLADHPLALHMVRDALAGQERQLDTHIRGVRWFLFASPVSEAGVIVGAQGTCWLVDECAWPGASRPGEVCCTLDRDIPGVGMAGDAVVWTGHRFVTVTPLRPEAEELLPPEFLRRVRGLQPEPPAEPQPPTPRLRVLR